ncbi:MAG: hypothetical protein DLM66_00290 [Candidatus Dormiibacter spiritus]|nr:MAG: hypothetical protein DLM66_00290 [Candidatus Dormibacteraeota bacterium]
MIAVVAAVLGASLGLGVPLMASHPVPSKKPKVTTDYWVSTTGSNSNDGLAADNAHAWLTLTKAGSTVGAGAVVHVLNGTYSANSFAASGTSTSRIVIRGEPVNVSP